MQLGIRGNLLERLGSRTADVPSRSVPSRLPTQLPKLPTPRYAESTVYPYLETNVDYVAMQFTQEPFPGKQSDWSIAIHGADTPFRHWSLVQEYIRSLGERRGYGEFVEYNTTVEKAEKDEGTGEWTLTRRKEGSETDYWRTETFDAVVVASGHYSVPYIPLIDGLVRREWRFVEVIESFAIHNIESAAKAVIAVEFPTFPEALLADAELMQTLRSRPRKSGTVLLS
ncbi:dimethylaniline monooxygenase [Colletotrichum musicola]|uniref:Dimethylaniline monooxygenase n=1 Tax=Colletotrichum musicola TaxID=2175873 RepID=A0A8H6NW12_9PEZI|nr:dimethylaniline monooxygenase [Colletotrichum musicola]